MTMLSKKLVGVGPGATRLPRNIALQLTAATQTRWLFRANSNVFRGLRPAAELQMPRFWSVERANQSPSFESFLIELLAVRSPLK
jgi:hypothetical protein